ncbi:MAG: ketoacyl-ACP synthase III [Candidatus Bipolaricaulota bacterium]|nr:MAG: ketoacyl-ACP synthase III [Candidatus Bipolaricaulota bacterium]
MGARLLGSGHFVPSDTLTNDDLARRVDTSDEWIVRRTGIRARHVLADGEIPAEMAVAAGRGAIERAGIAPSAVDLLIVATNFPDLICPGTAPFVADGLGLGETPFFDLKAGCTGFVYGLAVADAMVAAGGCRHVLLIGSEALSRVTDWLDRKTCVLFGDGAGAVVLGPGASDEGVLATAVFGDPTKAMLLAIPAGGTRRPASAETVEAREHFVRMEGAGVYRSAVPMMARSLNTAIARAELALADVDWIIPHQANLRIIESLVRRLGVEEDRVIVNLDRVANTSTASIPIALDEAIRDGRIERGQIVALTAFGAGATYAAAVIRM